LAADATGYVPEYRRAPEYPFPAAIDDAIDAYRGLLQAGIASDKIVVAGDSTGGGMAITVAQQAAALGLPKPAGIYVISPWADLTQTSDSYDARGPYDPMLSRTSLQGRADVRSRQDVAALGDDLHDESLSLYYQALCIAR